MPETPPEKSAEQPAPVRETTAAAPAPAAKARAHSHGEHGGIYSHFRQLAGQSGAEPPPEQFTPIFRKSEFSHPVNDAQKARALDMLQTQYGNRYVQRVLAPGPSARSDPDALGLIQRKEEGGSDSPLPTPPEVGASAGHPLDSSTRQSMESSFGHDFSGVRVHTDGAAQRAADNLNATAFTTGRDVYFNQGAYSPATEQGRGLLAHELAHVVQQDDGLATQGARGFHVSNPDDPLERQADLASQAVLRGEMLPTLATATTPTVHRQTAGAPPARGGGAAEPTIADYAIQFAGMATNLPIGEIIKLAKEGGTLRVPQKYLSKLKTPAFKVSDISLDIDENKKPTGGRISVGVTIPNLDGEGTLSIDKNGEVTGDVAIHFRNDKMPVLKNTDVTAKVKKDDFAFDAKVGFEVPKVSGELNYKYQDGKHSGSGKAHYEGAKLKGDIEIVMSEAGKASGSGHLSMELFKGLQGDVDVAVDEKRNVKVVGKLTVPGQIELFPEKKFEKNFFSFEKKFPLWGITIPVIDVNVGLFAEVHAGAGFRSKFGPGVLRDIELTGEFGTDPEQATEFGLSGEFFVPAGAEIVINAGGGIGLGLAIADITGGIEAVGVAGLYTALTFKPQFQYAGGKYTISGMAELAGVAQAKFSVNAFAKIDVGVWLFKGTVWRKDWTLAEWIWNMGLNVALRANMSYTLGDDFAPDINFETGQVDPEKFIKDVMPESGSPVPAPPKPPAPEKSGFSGAEHKPAAAAPGHAPSPPAAGGPPAKTQPAEGGPGKDGKGKEGGPGGQPPGKPGKDQPGDDSLPVINVHESLSLSGEGHTLTAVTQGKELVILMASGAGQRLRGMLGKAIKEVENSNKPDKAPVLGILGRTLNDAQEMELWYAWKAEGKPGTFEQYAARRLSRLSEDLRPLSGFGIKSLDQFFKGVPDFRFLPMQFRGSKWIRPNLYFFGSWKSFRDPIVQAEQNAIYKKVKAARAGRDATIWNDLLAAHQIPEDATLHHSDPTLDTFTEAMVLTLEYHLDHIVSVAKNWNAGGKDTTDSTRRAAAYQKTNLRVVTKKYNISKGSGGEEGEDKEDYFEAVGRSFTSSYAISPKNSKTVSGESYLNDKGEPIP